MISEVISTHTPELFASAVERAAKLLRSGEIVALPTETVYGLAANALDAAAVARVFAVKTRPARNPVIVHVADIAMAKRCVAEWPASAEALARSFWPGPLTMVLARSDVIPDVVTAGGHTVGVRWPSHPFIQAVIRACGFPLAAPSANLAGSISPTNAEHVRKGLGEQVPLIVDGGQSQVGIESTVVDLASPTARVLRPGMIHEESLAAVLGALEPSPANSEREPATLRSPGLLEKHYAPRARLVMLNWRNVADLQFQLAAQGADPGDTQIIAHTTIPAAGAFAGVSVIPHDSEAFARALYAELHRCDEAGAKWIVIEALPEGPQWRAIADRLRRASATHEPATRI